MTAPALTPELTGILTRYLEIQQQEQALKEEKAGLQERLAGYLEHAGAATWYPAVNGQKLKVRASTLVSVEYDEPMLRERLGGRYTEILAPDLKKIRHCLADLTPVLAPVLDRVGSPAPDKVRAALERGTVSAADFAGAFQKHTRRIVSVARVRPEGGGVGVGEERPA